MLNWRLSFAVVIVLMLSAKFHAGLPDPTREFQLQANSAEFWNPLIMERSCLRSHLDLVLLRVRCGTLRVSSMSATK